MFSDAEIDRRPKVFREIYHIKTVNLKHQFELECSIAKVDKFIADTWNDVREDENKDTIFTKWLEKIR